MSTCFVIIKTSGGIHNYQESPIGASLNQVTAERKLRESAEEQAESLRHLGHPAVAVITPARGAEFPVATIAGIPRNIGFLMRELPLFS